MAPRRTTEANRIECLAVDGDLHKVCLRLSVCQLSCQSAAVFFDSEMDAIRWSRLTHYIDAVPLHGQRSYCLLPHIAQSSLLVRECNYLEWLCCGGRNPLTKIHFLHFNSLINNYANAVARALSVLCHSGIDCTFPYMQVAQAERERGEQISSHIYCKSQWRHMYSTSCDILCIESWNVFHEHKTTHTHTHIHRKVAVEVVRINIYFTCDTIEISVRRGSTLCWSAFVAPLTIHVQFIHIKYNFRSWNCHAAYILRSLHAPRVRVYFMCCLRNSHLDLVQCSWE